jgi:HrpA-like RNA helicase
MHALTLHMHTPAIIEPSTVLQRTGRAGRVKPGQCFRLFSRRRHRGMDPFGEYSRCTIATRVLAALTIRTGAAPRRNA